MGLPRPEPLRFSGDAPSQRYVARNFSQNPDTDTAQELLNKLNMGICQFSPRLPRQPLVLYGAGNLGSLARDYLRAIGQDFALVVDRNAEALKSDPVWKGVALATPGEVASHYKKNAMLAVSVAASPFVPLQAALQEAGWVDIVPFYDIAEKFREKHPLSNGWFSGPLGAESLERTTSVLDRWSDDLSRAHHLQFLAWRVLREEWFFGDAPVHGHNRFFIPEVAACLGTEEVFIDGGAHHGSVTEKFVDLTKGRFSSVFAIEPDMASGNAFELLRLRFDPSVSKRVQLMHHALDAEGRERRFHDGLGYASQFADTGQVVLRTRTLDSIALSPSFIKLHLEGAEHDALLGAMETIQRHRPIVAVTTYHNDDGIWRTPLLLMEELKNYSFLMRLHSWCGTGAVVYAIPMERGA